MMLLFRISIVVLHLSEPDCFLLLVLVRPVLPVLLLGNTPDKRISRPLADRALTISARSRRGSCCPCEGGLGWSVRWESLRSSRATRARRGPLVLPTRQTHSDAQAASDLRGDVCRFLPRARRCSSFGS
eukprot:767474-Hanusia_phi.AAC.5